MTPELHHTISLLTRTPAALNVLLRDLPEASRNEGENTWSVFDVVGHLVHGERTDWMQRTRIVLQFGETRAFESFDRTGFVRESQDKSLGQLLDEFARLRSENLDEPACVESAAGGPRSAWTPSCLGSSYLIRAAGDLGST